MKLKNISKYNSKFKTKKNLSGALKNDESNGDEDPTLHSDVNNFLKKMDFSQFAEFMSQPQNEFEAFPSSGTSKENETQQELGNKKPNFPKGKRGLKSLQSSNMNMSSKIQQKLTYGESNFLEDGKMQIKGKRKRSQDFQSSDMNKSSNTQQKIKNEKSNFFNDKFQAKGKRERFLNIPSSDTKKSNQTQELDCVKAASPNFQVKGKKKGKMSNSHQTNMSSRPTTHKPNKAALNTSSSKSKFLQNVNHKNTAAAAYKKVTPLNLVKRNYVPDSNSTQNKDYSMTLKRKSLAECSPISKKKSTFHPSELKYILNSSRSGTRKPNSNETTSKAKPRVHVLKCKVDSNINDRQEERKVSSKVNTPIFSNPVALMKEKLQTQLESASFRLINEKLYTSSGEEGLQMFRDDPKAFEIYQKGYSNQVSRWPVNPLSLIISWLRKKPAKWVVGDFGCGEGTLAKSIRQKTYSIDIKACSPDIIECDMAHTPLESKSLNVVVFCLSLMGTNLSQFIVEANRVLVDRGVLKIADVESRFTKLKYFMKSLHKLGFKFSRKDQKEFFWMFDFLKIKDVTSNKKVDLHLAPCLYKKR